MSPLVRILVCCPFLISCAGAGAHAADIEALLARELGHGRITRTQERALDTTLWRMIRAPRIPPTGRFVLINIPAYELIAYENGQEAMRSKVIVGRPEPINQTPRILSHVLVIRYNPPWIPPANMPGAEPQPPGPDNWLGTLVFLMDNREEVVLHDTPRRELFDRPRRALSHGCIRLQNFRELAAWMLRVPVSDIDRSIATYGTFDERLRDPVPVYMAYYTAYPDNRSRIQYFYDVYHLDRNRQY